MERGYLRGSLMPLKSSHMTQFSANDMARRSLQPHARERVHSLDSNEHRRAQIIKERRHSLGGRGLGDTGYIMPAGSQDLSHLYDLPWTPGGPPGQYRSPDSRSASGPNFRTGSPIGTSSPNFFPKTNKINVMMEHSIVKGQTEEVIHIREGYKSYGRGAARKSVLQNINMTVKKGEIYGLLGASGCGKTTLLSIIVGRRNLDSGVLRVLGGTPGDGHCGIPGPAVGYMPQELALYEEFSIIETVRYFGKIYNMTNKQIRAQLEFLLTLLDLPTESRKIGSFSGGQQRRVSFLVSLLPDPQLLILDEPTVGVDPILRQHIWEHLQNLATKRQKTIIITTHYIEETIRANRIGMMNAGRLSAEGAPKRLLKQYNVDRLEDVFLTLCVQDRKNERLHSTDNSNIELRNCSPGFSPNGISSVSSNGISAPASPNGISAVSANGGVFANQSRLNPKKQDGAQPKFSFSTSLPSAGNFVALLKKNILKLQRNPAMLLFIFILPAIQVVFFCIAIGQEPAGLRIGVVNQENSNCTSSIGEDCEFSDLGCKYLNKLQTKLNLIRFNDTESAEEAVQNGDVWGVLSINRNFSSAYVSRMTAPVSAEQELLDESSLGVRLDMSNQQVALTLKGMIVERFDNFSRSLLQSCNFLPDAGSLPIHWGAPIYGDQEPSFTEFMAPGIIILIIYFLAVALTGEAFISERSTGLLDRSWIAGVKPSEIIASHIVAQFVVMLIQTGVTLASMIWGFKVPCRGPFVWLAVITILQGLAGMSFGFLISALCDSQAVAMQLSIGSFYPNLLLSGILWPVEGMPVLLRTISKFLPNTLSCQAMRDIMLRGWGIEREEVYLGVVSSCVWITLFLSLSWITIRIRN